MSLKYAPGLACCLGTLVLAKIVTLHAVLNDTIDPHKILHNPSGPNPPSNESISLPSVTSSKSILIQCDGNSYGSDLQTSDCEEAIEYLPVNITQVQYTERNTTGQKKIFPLPYRVMGDNASCYVQPVLIDGATSAKASPNEIRNAAAMIRNRCASGGKLQGGKATNIGGDNNLAVIMGAYSPPSAIQCVGHKNVDSFCQDVLHDMPATTDKERLQPQIVQSGSCILNLKTKTIGNSDTLSWYEIWEATTALESACLRHGLEGSMVGIGDHGKLVLTLNINEGVEFKKGPMVLRPSKFFGQRVGNGKWSRGERSAVAALTPG